MSLKLIALAVATIGLADAQSQPRTPSKQEFEVHRVRG